MAFHTDSLPYAPSWALLCCAVAAMADALRPGDALGRLGGDEFAALLPGAGAVAAGEIADRLQLALSPRASACVGAAVTGEDDRSAKIGAVPDPVISFLSDYGLTDEFVGVCHGVIAQGCPQARVIDVAHGVPAHDVRAGALILARALPHLPVGVHLAVVDPGVGGPRRGVAVATADGRTLVGPDNGLLEPAAAVAGGATAAVDLAGSPLVRAPVSATFHGRDVFAPVAAGLAAGASLQQVGEPIDPAALVALALPRAHAEDGALLAHVVYVDRFGNLQLNASPAELVGLGLGWTPGASLAVEASAGPVAVRYARTFADVPDAELVLHEDAAGMLALAVNRGSAARRLGVGVDAQLRIALA